MHNENGYLRILRNDFDIIVSNLLTAENILLLSLILVSVTYAEDLASSVPQSDD